jgi:hypothetical protein
MKEEFLRNPLHMKDSIKKESPSSIAEEGPFF